MAGECPTPIRVGPTRLAAWRRSSRHVMIAMDTCLIRRGFMRYGEKNYGVWSMEDEVCSWAVGL